MKSNIIKINNDNADKQCVCALNSVGHQVEIDQDLIKLDAFQSISFAILFVGLSWRQLPLLMRFR